MARSPFRNEPLWTLIERAHADPRVMASRATARLNPSRNTADPLPSFLA
jgi:hypothetical protein